MSKLTGATRSELEGLAHEYGWAQDVEQMRARMLQDGNLPGGDAPTRRELLRRRVLMSAVFLFPATTATRGKFAITVWPPSGYMTSNLLTTIRLFWPQQKAFTADNPAAQPVTAFGNSNYLISGSSCPTQL